MPFNRPTLPELVQRDENDLKTRLQSTGTFLRRAFLKVIARVIAGAAHLLHGHLAFIAEQVIYDTAIFPVLRRWGSIWSVNSPPASFANGVVEMEGTDGAEIPDGTILRRSDGLEYETDGDQTIASGTASLAVTCLTAGDTGNCDAGVQLTLLAPIPGVVSTGIVGEDGIQGGSDEESEDEYRARFLDRIRRPPLGGAKVDYEKWAKEIPGVTRVWVFPLWLGLGTVGVTFVRDDDDSMFPSEDEVEEVANHIESVRPVGADVYTFAPSGVDLDFTIRLDPDNENTRAAVEAELGNLILRDGEPGGKIYWSRMHEAISIAAGEEDHTLIAPSGDFQATTSHLPVMGEITWV